MTPTRSLSRFFSVVTFCALLAGIGPAATAQPVLPLDSLLAQGDNAYQKFENALALDWYFQALDLESTGSSSLFFRLARTHFDHGLDLLAIGHQADSENAINEAIRYARELLRVQPNSAEGHVLLAAALGHQAQHVRGFSRVSLGREAETHIFEAVALDSTLAHGQAALGIYYREVVNLSWVERTLVRLFTSNMPAISLDQAIQSLEQAVTLHPGFVFGHFELAQTYYQADRVDDANYHLQLMIALPPETTQDQRNQVIAQRWLNEGWTQH